jgi:hypothetical protein
LLTRAPQNSKRWSVLTGSLYNTRPRALLAFSTARAGKIQGRVNFKRGHPMIDCAVAFFIVAAGISLLLYVVIPK